MYDASRRGVGQRAANGPRDWRGRCGSGGANARRRDEPRPEAARRERINRDLPSAQTTFSTDPMLLRGQRATYAGGSGEGGVGRDHTRPKARPEAHPLHATNRALSASADSCPEALIMSASDSQCVSYHGALRRCGSAKHAAVPTIHRRRRGRCGRSDRSRRRRAPLLLHATVPNNQLRLGSAHGMICMSSRRCKQQQQRMIVSSWS